MSNIRDKVAMKRDNMNPKEFWNSLPPETPRMVRKRNWTKFKKILNFLGIGTATSSRGTGNSNSQSTSTSYSQPTPPPSRDIRDEYHFDPRQWALKEMQAEAYHSLIDGRGDDDRDSRG